MLENKKLQLHRLHRDVNSTRTNTNLGTFSKGIVQATKFCFQIVEHFLKDCIFNNVLIHHTSFAEMFQNKILT